MEYKANNQHFWLLLGSIFFYIVKVFPVVGLYEAVDDYKNFKLFTEDLTLREISEQYGNRKGLIFLSIGIHSLYLFMFIFWDNIFYGGLLQ